MTKLTLPLAASLTVMSGALVAPALPAIDAFFAAAPDAPGNVSLLVRSLLTLPALGIIVGAPAAGWWLDRNRRRPILLVALVVYALAGTAGFVLEGLYAILVSRFVLGLSVAVILPTVVTLVGEYYEGEERSSFLGLQAAFMALGGTVFVALSGVLAGAGWRYVFLVYAFSLVVAALVAFALPEPERDAGAAFAKTENAADLPPVSRWVWFTYACTVLGMLAFYLVPVQSAFVMRAVGVEAEWLLGGGLIVATLVSAAVSANYGRLRRRFGIATLFALAFLGMGVGYVVIGLGASVAAAIVGSMIAGGGAGLLMPNGNACVIEASAPARRGRLLGGLTTAVFVGQFVSPLAFSPVEAVAGGLLPGHLWFGAGTVAVAAGIWAVARGASPTR